MIEQGATTLWEAWDVEDNLELEPGEGLGDVVSVNHSSFTVVSEWFYEVLAGLRFGDGPGAGAVRIVPRPVAALDHASAAVETRRGRLASRWERTADGLELAVTVPWNGTATVRVPLPDGAERVAEGGDVLWESEPAADLPAGIADVSAVEDAVEVEVGAGDYEFLTE
jgi:alpha-L-rhamnosidase